MTLPESAEIPEEKSTLLLIVEKLQAIYQRVDTLEAAVFKTVEPYPYTWTDHETGCQRCGYTRTYKHTTDHAHTCGNCGKQR